jgi:hypothetical protein
MESGNWCSARGFAMITKLNQDVIGFLASTEVQKYSFGQRIGQHFCEAWVFRLAAGSVLLS